ncbi:VWA domain-containing protein [Methanolobus sp. WCC4]|uniref:nitric oxide reductase activation protein NorD n=1 Tax=Methanolobus sp. WCC4 TaxID=3125784 RepID=UPI0030F53969
MAAETGNNEPVTNGKIEELIAEHFPKLDRSEITGASAGFEKLHKDELEAILHAGKGALKRGMRVLIAYLGSAPHVYKKIGKDEFESWLALAREISKLSVSCCEGFFDSSLAIIEKGGLELLRSWTDTGIALSEQNKWMAIAYFKHTGQVIISTGPERFSELVNNGKNIGKVNVKVAEAYFEHLYQLKNLLTAENFESFCHITKKVINVHWLTSIELINIAVKVLPDVPPSRRQELLTAIDNIVEFGEAPAMALLRNAGQILKKADEKELTNLMEIAMDIAAIDNESAKSFLETIPKYLSILEMSEVEEWKDRGIASFLNNKPALRSFIPSVLSLGDHYDDTNKDVRSMLIDRGIISADIQPECVRSYFENASQAYNILSTEMFEEWAGTGDGIAIQDPEVGSDYYGDSIAALDKIDPQQHEEIFRIANVLLTKEGAIFGVFFKYLILFIDREEPENASKWADIGLKVYAKDRKLALDYFSNSPALLERMDMEELEEWTLKGLEAAETKEPAGKAYFSLESRGSRELVEELTGAIALKKVANVLRFYALGLSGSNFVIRSMSSLPHQFETEGMNPVIAGNTIYLAPKMGVYQEPEDNFKIYKLSVMHEVGHVRFTTPDIAQEEVDSLEERILGRYPVKDGDKAHSSGPNKEDSGPIDLLSLFPNQILAATIFGLLEDARIEYLVMDQYKGVRIDLEDVRHRMLLLRPVPEDELESFMEALLWITTGHEPEFGINEAFRIVLERTREEIDHRIFSVDSTTFSSLELAFGIYSMLDDVLGPLEEIEYRMIRNIGYRGMDVGATGPTDPMMSRTIENVIKNFIPETETDLTADEERQKEQATDRPTQAMENNWRLLGRYKYDEWDTTINDYRSEWSTINEIEPIGGTTAYYDRAMERYSNEISLLRHTFGLIRPEAFHRMKEQNDGTEIDIDAFTESLIARKCGVNPDDRLYIRWDKHERDVATLFLMDVSASTRKILGADGRSIMDVEKDALIIMSQALESIGDKYAIYAFSGKSREAVEYFVIKDFDEKLSDDVARRISILQPASNTRLGPAIRHSIKKLEHAGANTKMMVLLSDGEPYDRSRGEDAYQGDIAQEDTRVAISEGRNKGMHFFCITVDKNPGEYLDNIFSDVGYTIIDDALMLPETLPLVYKRLTT